MGYHLKLQYATFRVLGAFFETVCVGRTLAQDAGGGE